MLRLLVPKGLNTYTTDRLFPYRIPNFVIVALVQSSSFRGDFQKSCMNFANFGVKSISVNTEDAIPFTKKYICDYAGDEYLEPYLALFGALGQNVTGNGLTKESFKAGNAIYLFQLSEGIPSNLMPHRSGPIRVNIDFAAGVENPVEVLILGTFPYALTLDKHREPSVVRL